MSQTVRFLDSQLASISSESKLIQIRQKIRSDMVEKVVADANAIFRRHSVFVSPDNNSVVVFREAYVEERCSLDDTPKAYVSAYQFPENVEDSQRVTIPLSTFLGFLRESGTTRPYEISRDLVFDPSTRSLRVRPGAESPEPEIEVTTATIDLSAPKPEAKEGLGLPSTRFALRSIEAYQFEKKTYVLAVGTNGESHHLLYQEYVSFGEEDRGSNGMWFLRDSGESALRVFEKFDHGRTYRRTKPHVIPKMVRESLDTLYPGQDWRGLLRASGGLS